MICNTLDKGIIFFGKTMFANIILHLIYRSNNFSFIFQPFCKSTDCFHDRKFICAYFVSCRVVGRVNVNFIRI